LLARANRVTRAADFRAAVRRGRRVGTTGAVLHILDRRAASEPARFGFVVGRSVGGAVVRNRIKRRLRAVCFELLPGMRDGRDIVIRALPGSDHVAWATLQSEIADGLARGGAR
jgi:ribonuclease P protein component